MASISKIRGPSLLQAMRLPPDAPCSIRILLGVLSCCLIGWLTHTPPPLTLLCQSSFLELASLLLLLFYYCYYMHICRCAQNWILGSQLSEYAI